MAAVYLAELDGPRAFSKQVALKVIHRHLMADESFVKMFVDEAQIAARLHHPNIVQTFDLVHTDDFLAMAMEYAPGLSSASLMPGSSRPLELPVSAELVAYIGAEAAAGLQHAHTLTDSQGVPYGVVHRDVSPANVHIGYDGRVRIVDFGIARARGRLSTTAHGLVKGTFAYVPPEQFAGAEPTPRSDVWSLGVVLWELLAGRRLFRRDTEADTARAVLSSPIPPIESLRSDFPLALGVAIHRAIERDPERRWPSAKALEDHLRAILPAKIETVRDPLLAALAPHREQHAAEVRTLLEVQELEAAEGDESNQVVLESDEPAPSASAPAGASSPLPTSEPQRPPPSDATPMVAADLIMRPPRRRGLALGAVVGALALLAVLVFAMGRTPEATRSRGAHATVTRSAPEAPPPPPVPPEAPTPAPPARVSLQISSTVPGARVSLDGRSLGPAPVRTLVDRDAGDHVIRVEAEGRQPLEQHVSLDAPVQLALDPLPPAATAPPPRRWRKTLTFDTNVYR